MATTELKRNQTEEINRLVKAILSLNGREPDERMVKSVMEIIGWGHRGTYIKILRDSVETVNYALSYGKVTPEKLRQRPGVDPRVDIRYLGALGPLRTDVLIPVRGYEGDFMNRPYELASIGVADKYINFATNLITLLRVYNVQKVTE